MRDMRVIKSLIAGALLLTTVAGCSDDERFRVSGHIEGNPTMNLRVGYYSRGAYQSLVTAAREGEFEFFGNSPQPTVIEIFDYDNRLLGRGYIANGQTLELNFKPGDFYSTEAGGNDVSTRWNAFLLSNGAALGAGGSAANSVIAEYIGSHPDDIVSTLLLTHHYNVGLDAAGADSLLELIAATARPAALTESFNYQLQRLITATDTIGPLSYFDGDSARIFEPASHRASVIAIDNRDSRTDSIVAALEAMHRRRGAAVLELGDDSDMGSWRVRLTLDSAAWQRGWVSSATASPQLEYLGITTVPFFLVCDSIGYIHYRGASSAEARTALFSLTPPRR